MVPRDGLLQVNWIKHLAEDATGQKSHSASQFPTRMSHLSGAEIVLNVC